MRLDEILFSTPDEAGNYIMLIDKMLELSKMSVVKPPKHKELLSRYRDVLTDKYNLQYIFWVLMSAHNGLIYRRIKKELGI